MNKEIDTMLHMMLHPAFCARGGILVNCNAAAHSLCLEEGTALSSLVMTGQEELDALQTGCLYLQLSLPGGTCGAAVTRMEDTLIFLLDQDTGELQALSLAAKELREPLNNLMAISSQLLPSALPDSDPKISGLLARMSKELYQLQRTLNNMSDAPQASALSHQEMRNAAQVFDDIFEKAASLLALSGIRLSYRGLSQDVFTLMDMDQIERAVLNILSNSSKFLGSEGTIHASLSRQGSFLRLSIQDDGPGIPEDILGTLFQRYLRQPGIEDNRQGLGLGMVLIRSAAASHGGTVLIDQPANSGTRVTLTLRIRQVDATVHSPRQTLSGGFDQALVELSQILPASAYEEEL